MTDGDITKRDLWLRCFHPSPDAGIRLLCFPYAGGSATAFFAMSTALRQVAEVHAVQYPGRQDRRGEPCVTSIPALADQVLSVLDEWPDPRPLALFGHSMGAALAFEVARRLERRGPSDRPAMLFVSGRQTPRFRSTDPVHLRDEQGLLTELRLLSPELAKALIDPEIRQMAMPAIRGDYRAAETYVYDPGPALRCPIVALTGDSDPRADIDDVAGWREYTEGEFAMYVFPGGHFFLNEQPDAVHSQIRTHLESLRTVETLNVRTALL